MSAITLRATDLSDLLEKTIPAHEPVLISGKPGVGKSGIVEQACQRAKADCVLMHPSISDPTDFKGMPWVSNGEANFLPFGELKTLINAKKLTACFFDDLGQAKDAVQAATMQLLHARRINGHEVSKHVVFIAATNRRQDRGGVQGILEPVKSRFITSVELEAHMDDWRPWAVNANVAAEVIAFLNFRPALLSDFKPTQDMTNSPSPRTWHAVSRLLSLGLSKRLQLPTICGAVGQGAGEEFVSFLRVWQDMVNPDLVLTSPDTAPIPKEPSALYALSTAIAQRVKSASMQRYCRYLERLTDDGKMEFAACSIKTAVAGNDSLTNTAAYIKMMSGPLGQVMIGQ
jgi:hypothetical protein